MFNQETFIITPDHVRITRSKHTKSLLAKESSLTAQSTMTVNQEDYLVEPTLEHQPQHAVINTERYVDLLQRNLISAAVPD